MDLVLEYCDKYFFNAAYSAIPLTSTWKEDHIGRQALSLFLITYAFALVFYFSMATASFHFLYDKSQMKHPKFLKDQIRKEIKVAVDSMIPLSALTVPWFVGEVRGYSKLYSDLHLKTWQGVAYEIWTMAWFLLFTDCIIYWVHRWLHHPLLYTRIHKPHHRWIVPTPYASHAFHPLDGYAQSIAYHMFVYLFPMHRVLYLVMFIFVNVWTVSIHDGTYFSRSTLINGAANHTLHHLYFKCNYGQYFTLWDRIGGTYREPKQDEYERKDVVKEAVAVEKMLVDPDLKDASVEYLVDNISKNYGKLQ